MVTRIFLIIIRVKNKNVYDIIKIGENMKDKNGFTLVELTLAIVLLLLLALLVVPNLLQMGDGTKEKMYESKIELALSGAYKYGKDNIDKLSNNCTDISIGALINLEYVSGDDESGFNMIDPISGDSMNNIIICVAYEDNEVKTRLK